MYLQLLRARTAARVVDEDLFREWFGDVFAFLQRLDKLLLGRRIVVAVVGADDDVVLADAFGEVWDVFVGLASDEQIVISEQLGAVFELGPVFK